MSEYIILNVQIIVERTIDLEGFEEPGKPVDKFTNYYFGKLLDAGSSELRMMRTRKNKIDESVPNRVLRNEHGIALIRIHNKEDITIYDLPKDEPDQTSECVGIATESYPYSYVVIDYRDGRCQMAIEKSSSWGSKIDNVKNIMIRFFQSSLFSFHGMKISVKEKSIPTKFENFIDERTIDYNDYIEAFTFQYVNLKKYKNVQIPPALTDQMLRLSSILEEYNALEATTTVKMGEGIVDNDKLKQLSTVVTMCCDNAFQLVVKFHDYGDYICNEDIVAKKEMNDIVISNFRDYIDPEMMTSDFDLVTWLDEANDMTANNNYGNEIPAKPKR